MSVKHISVVSNAVRLQRRVCSYIWDVMDDLNIRQENSIRAFSILYFHKTSLAPHKYPSVKPENRILSSSVYMLGAAICYRLIYKILYIILVIDYLLERFERGQIYTWIDTLLLAINPNGEVSTGDIYDLSRANNLYNNVTCKEVAPHIFAVAARAYYRIAQGLGKPSQVNPGILPILVRVIVIFPSGKITPLHSP